MEIGYVKRGRGYGRVEIKHRCVLPKCTAVTWRWAAIDNGQPGQWGITDSSRVLAEKPLTDGERHIRAQYAKLTAALTAEWQSMSDLQQSVNGWAGVWSMCKKLEKEGVAEVRDVHFKPDHRGPKAWRSEARRKTT